MKYIINGILMLLASLCFVLFVLLGIDTSVAHRDYERLKYYGDYERKVDGCIFEWVCKHYTEQLWKGN